MAQDSTLILSWKPRVKLKRGVRYVEGGRVGMWEDRKARTVVWEAAGESGEEVYIRAERLGARKEGV